MSETSSAQRRYTRVQLTDLGAVSSLMGVHVKWPSGEQTRVLDLSYAGAALERPKQNLNHGEKTQLQFLLRDIELKLPAKLVWFNDRLVGCQFSELDIDTQRAIDRFLEVPLVGANLKPVDERYFAAQDDFKYWFAGPNDSHVFLWTSTGSSGAISKALVQWGERSFLYENSQLTHAGVKATAADTQRVLQILSQIPSDHAPIKPVIEKLAQQL